jgi:cell division protein FtsI (penicillin-binding protein 3)
VGQWIRFRLGFLFMSFVFFFALIAFRLLQLQVLPNGELTQLGQKQFTRLGKKSPYRMPIYDRNHEEMAVSMSSSSVFARPKLLRSRKRTAHHLANIFGGPPSKWLQKLDMEKTFVWIQRQVNEEAAEKLAALSLPGVFIEPENRRLYPNGMLAGSLIGFTDIDGNGISGLEHSLDKELLESPNHVRMLKDGKGNPSYIDKRGQEVLAKKAAIYLTLDRRIQNVVEEELVKAMEESGAKSAMAVVMDPHNGEIFAMGQLPGFDPNNAKDFSQSLFTNRVVSHLYEPGSTLKVLFAAEAIQSGILNKDSLIDCENGKLRVADRTINEADTNHRFGLIPLKQVVEASSNVGAVKIAQQLGSDRVRATLDKFGLTSKTNVFLPGEVSSGPKSDEFWKPIHLATVGFGQGISVTPLQMVAAYAPFANGGYLIQPRILMRESPAVTGESPEIRRVLSTETVQVMREMMLAVTEGKHGTGKKAQIAGLKVAGKTGTAQKYEPGEGYSNEKYFSSFIGFLPADNPQLLVGIMVDEPSKGSYYGGEAAGPIFKRIAERSLQILDRIPKSVASADKPASAPKPEPMPVSLSLSEDGSTVMPDLKGLSMREVLRILARYSQNISVNGAGFLVTQSPSPGSALQDSTSIQLSFGREAPLPSQKSEKLASVSSLTKKTSQPFFIRTGARAGTRTGAGPEE